MKLSETLSSKDLGKIQTMRIGSKIEILVRVDEIFDAYDVYGFGWSGVIKNLEEEWITVMIDEQGLYGASDGPDTKIRGNPVEVRFAVNKIHRIDKYSDDEFVIRYITRG